jgi:hypothetical protein
MTQCTHIDQIGEVTPRTLDGQESFLLIVHSAEATIFTTR